MLQNALPVQILGPHALSASARCFLTCMQAALGGHQVWTWGKEGVDAQIS